MSASALAEPLLLLRQRPLGIQRLAQRFERFAMQPLRLIDVAPLIFEAPDEDLIGAVGQVDRREHQQAFQCSPRSITTAASAPALPATMKLGALQRNSSCHTCHHVRSDDSAIAPATRLVLTKK